MSTPITELDVAGVTDAATGLPAPWDAEVAPDGTVWVSLRDTGEIARVEAGEVTTLAGPGADALAATVEAAGEAGLLGLALLPSDPRVLYAYVTRADGNAVVRMALEDDALGAPVDVLTGIPKAANHDGGRIAFGPDGYLYVATGDAGQPELAQDPSSLAGKVLRLQADGTDADGAPAPDNPWGTLVWSMGHRNVQGLAWLPDGTMVASEFGQSDADELNVIVPGANYGWPHVEGLVGAPEGTELGATVSGFTYPVAQWSPTSTASPSGIAASAAGVFVAALRGEAVFWVPLDGSAASGFAEPQTLLDGVGRVRDVSHSARGELLVLTNNTDGRGDPNDGDDRLLRVELTQ
ncbi:PQQ-dependent sugar dehydrogenase [Demequina globuliformis]|uniref:PQQ-dependent sugar dehydrogenase n=1 Tax=Demequina globuliformis TaxID=676202 RepID=UPI001F25BAF0|nr:PQQ-dependent sugar dehydrogenase [Demequina globuliformis]